MTLTIGNIVAGNNSGRHGIILAVRRDGTRVKIYEYGPDREVWVGVNKFTVETAGLETCYKCAGSGLYYFGGAVVNGVYTGKTGECYGCGGKGKQSDDDRRRCHYYWHRKVEEGEDIESPLEQSPKAEAPAPKPKGLRQAQAERRQSREHKPAPKIKSKRRDPRSTVVQKADKLDHLRDQRVEGSDVLINCKGCGTMHRDDTLCPWD